MLTLVKLRRFAIWYLLPRQDYFELIPSRSNNLQPVRGLLEPVALALELQHRAAVHEAVQDSAGHGDVAQVLAPVLHHPVGCCPTSACVRQIGVLD